MKSNGHERSLFANRKRSIALPHPTLNNRGISFVSDIFPRRECLTNDRISVRIERSKPIKIGHGPTLSAGARLPCVPTKRTRRFRCPRHIGFNACLTAGLTFRCATHTKTRKQRVEHAFPRCLNPFELPHDSNHVAFDTFHSPFTFCKDSLIL